jgi:outer membrane protein TolC
LWQFALAQTAPVSPDRPWHAKQEAQIENDVRQFHESRFNVDADRTYSLAELIDLAEAHNPETRVAWEGTRAQLATLGVARSELYPTLAAIALSQTDGGEALLGDRFYRQTEQTFEGTLELNYTIFDFGARGDRIAAARAQLLAPANFAFNDTHRKLIYQVEQAYYGLLNARNHSRPIEIPPRSVWPANQSVDRFRGAE